MSLREELERVMGAVLIGNRRSVPRQDLEYSVRVANEFLRDHGQALLDALDADMKWKEMTDQARAIQHRHLDNHEGDVYHAMQSLASKFGHRWNGPLTTDVYTARSKTVDGGGVLEGIKNHRGNPENPPST